MATSGDRDASRGRTGPADTVAEPAPTERRARSARAGERVLAGVLVGGSSRRMSRPKQLLELRGRTLLDRVVDALLPAVDEVVLLGSGELPASQSGRVVVPDAPGCTGPLAGLIAGLRWAPDACWVVAACDLPLLEPAAVRWLLGQRRPGLRAVLPHTGKGVEPLLALYEPSALADLEALAAAGVLAPRKIAEAVAVATPEPPPELLRCWFNVNSPADLLALDRS